MNEVIRHLLLGIIESLVDTPSSLHIRIFEDEQKVVYYITTEPGEEGQIIGKKGTLANSIRLVIKAAAKRYGGKYVYMEVLDSKTTEIF